jgi:hypothetical protein
MNSASTFQCLIKSWYPKPEYENPQLPIIEYSSNVESLRIEIRKRRSLILLAKTLFPEVKMRFEAPKTASSAKV